LGPVTEGDAVRNADTAAEISQQEIPHRHKITKNKRHYATLGILKFAGPSQRVRVGIPPLRSGLSGEASVAISSYLMLTLMICAPLTT